MPDWSKIGRSSRRKGKSYERAIASMLREVTGKDWQTTRNSGRTDLKGDIYCVELGATQVVVECKDRATFQPLCMLQGNCAYVDEIQKVREETKGASRVVIFSKVRLLGDLVGVLDDDVDRFIKPYESTEPDGLWYLFRPAIIAADGTKYRLFRQKPLTADEAKRLLFMAAVD